MRARLVLLAAILLAAIFAAAGTAFAQQPSSQPEGNSSSSASSNDPVTVEGCIVQMNGAFRLLTHQGSFKLKGDHNSMFSLNGTWVSITGMLSHKEQRFPTLTVTKLKKLADNCQ